MGSNREKSNIAIAVTFYKVTNIISHFDGSNDIFKGKAKEEATVWRLKKI